MAQFNPNIKVPTDFNKGKKYKAGDAVQADTLNNLIESALWVQTLAFGETVTIASYNPETEELTVMGLQITNTEEEK